MRLPRGRKEQADIDAKLILRKARYGEFQDNTLRLWFDQPSMQYRSQQSRYPLAYVEFSAQNQEEGHHVHNA